MSHWHHVLVERKDSGEAVQLGAFLSSDRYGTREAAADDVGRILEDLKDVERAAAESAREDLISSEEGVELARWASASALREIHLVECTTDDCEETVRAFEARLMSKVERQTGKPVFRPPPPPVG